MAKRTSAKPLIFISHVSEEKIVADSLRVVIESHFLNMVEVFVSSISLGREWFDSIKNALHTCDLAIVLASPNSIKRPWVNFEAGSIWSQNKIVIPLCHAGMTKEKLQLPMSHLQGTDATNVDGLQQIIDDIADIVKANRKKADFSEFIKTVTEFELTHKEIKPTDLPASIPADKATLEIQQVGFTIARPETEVARRVMGDGEEIIFDVTLHCEVKNTSLIRADAWGVSFEIDEFTDWMHKDTSMKSGLVRSEFEDLLPKESRTVQLTFRHVTFETWFHSPSLASLLVNVLLTLNVKLEPVSHNFIGEIFHYGCHGNPDEENGMTIDLLNQLSSYGITPESE